MRFLGLDLIAFGPFTDAALDLRGAGDGRGLHVVYGRNEAGKSTALRATRGLLFGIPVNTRDAHVHPMNRLRIGARLIDAKGTVLEVVRRKGRRGTLLDPRGEVVDEARLKRLLGGTDERLFLTMFGLDHDSLRAGAEALLAGQGDVGEGLFDASLGGRGIHELGQQLQAEADELFTPQARTRKLNEALRELTEASRRSRAEAKRPEAWLSQKQALDDAESERMRLELQRRSIGAELNRLRRAQRILPLVAERRELLEERTRLGAPTPLPDAASERRVQAQQTLAECQRERRWIEHEMDRLLERRSQLQVPEALVAVEEVVIEGLRNRLGGHRKAAQDLPRVRGKMQQLEDEVKALASQLGGKAPTSRSASEATQDVERSQQDRQPQLLEAPTPRRGGVHPRPSDDASHSKSAPATPAASAIPTIDVATRERIRTLGLKKVAGDERRKSLERTRLQLDSERAAIQSERAALPPTIDATTLKAAVDRAQRAGDLEARRAEHQAELQAIDDDLAEHLGRLGLADHDPARVAAFQLPTTATVSRIQQEWETLDQQVRHNATDQADTAARLAELDVQIGELEGDGTVATVDDLDQARKHRDRLVEQLAPDTAVHHQPLLRVAILESDQAADRLWRDAERTTQLSALQAQRTARKARAADLAQQATQLGKRQAALTTEWKRAWKGVPGTPQPPAEMRDWLRLHADLTALHAKRRAASARLDATVTTIAEQRTALLDALSDSGQPHPEADRPSAVARAAALLADLAASAHTRVETERTAAAIDRRWQALRQEIEIEDQAAADFASRWAADVAVLGLAADALPEEADAVLEHLDQLTRKREEMEGQRRRVVAMERDQRELAAEFRQLVDERAPDLAKLDWESAATVLLERDEQAQGDRAAPPRGDADLADRGRLLEEIELRQERAQVELRQLIEQAGVADLAALIAAEDTEARRRVLTGRIEDVEQQLLRHGEGLRLHALVSEVDDTDADTIAIRLDDLQASAAAVDEQFNDTVETVGRLQAGMRHFDDMSVAAEAAADAQAWAAKARRLVDQYVKVKLASHLLDREVERYRQRHQGPVLSRAAELFPRLTLQRYKGLQVGLSGRDQAVLRAVRASGEDVPVSALSDGTRDQLYLALRLASLERYMASNPPMPLVLDDILIHFDDDRARAALEVLGDLAAEMQILFFTHHARMKELAAEAVSKDRLFTYDLGAPAL